MKVRHSWSHDVNNVTLCRIKKRKTMLILSLRLLVEFFALIFLLVTVLVDPNMEKRKQTQIMNELTHKEMSSLPNLDQICVFKIIVHLVGMNGIHP